MDQAIQIQQRSLSRSGLLKLGAVAALVLGAGPAAKALEGASAPAATDDPAVATRVRGPRHLRLATYVPLVGSTFTIHRTGASPLSVKLAAATRLHGVGESFSLIFRGHANAKLGQNTYNLEHPILGTFPLFVVPIGRATKGQDFQVVVNRIPASLMPRV
jgi:Domain of unknown function (DUF6916)